MRNTGQTPDLIILTGQTGSGKTTLALELAVAGNLAFLSSDIARKLLAGLPPELHRYEEPERGIYSPEFSRRTYDRLLYQALTLLWNGRSVIIDASFRKANDRRKAYDVAQQAGARFWILECRAPEEIVRERLQRRKEEHSLSNATLEIFDELKRGFEPVGDEPGNHLVVDTTRPVQDIVREVLETVGRKPVRR